MKKIAFLSYDFRIGGAEKAESSLIPEFIKMGYAVDLVLLQNSGPLLQTLDERVRVISLNKNHVSQAVPVLAAYLRRRKPDVFISSQTHLNVLAVLAREFSLWKKFRLILTETNNISLNDAAKGGRDKMLVDCARFFYPRADSVIIVSEGAAAEMIRVLKINPEKVHVIYNPLCLPEIQKSASEGSGEPWLETKICPVLLAVGRLVPQKNFSFLLDVFAQVRKEKDCRLMILGEGEERAALQQKAERLGLADSIRMPGAVLNPYACLSRSDLMLCTSLYEGFNIAIAESLACGTPVISLDCPYGPREILENGKYGTLIPMGDQMGMADAILSQLDQPVFTRSLLQSRAEDFSAVKIAQEYQNLIEK